MSYFTGQQVGQNLKKQGLSLDQEMIAKGIADALSDAPPLLDQNEIRQTQNKLNEMASEITKKIAQANLEKAHNFFEENKKNPGWVTTASGLQYRVAVAGKGRRPTAKDAVLVHYVATLLNGRKFESSLDRGSQPAEFKVKSVIKGWSEALLLMPEGSRWTIVVPSHLAYGASGNGIIPPNAALMFDVELVKVK